MRTLQGIAKAHEGQIRKGTDKASHGFAGFYDIVLGPLRSRPCKILEVGVRSGGSIRMWEEGFPHATIIGVDSKLQFRSDCELTTLIEADVTKLGVMEKICKEHGPFDAVIDDADHTEVCTRAIANCFPDHIVPGGWWFIEDVHAGYWIPSCKGATDFARSLFDAVNHHGVLRSCGRENWHEPRTHFDREIAQIVMRPGIVGVQRHKP